MGRELYRWLTKKWSKLCKKPRSSLLAKWLNYLWAADVLAQHYHPHYDADKDLVGFYTMGQVKEQIEEYKRTGCWVPMPAPEEMWD